MKPLDMSIGEKLEFIWACVGYHVEVAGPAADDVLACQLLSHEHAVVYVTGSLGVRDVQNELMCYAALYSGALPSELR